MDTRPDEQKNLTPTTLPERSRTLIKCFQENDKYLIKQKAMELAPGGNPNFELLFKEGETTQISRWKREMGERETVKCIYILIDNLNNYFNVSRPMNSDQIMDLAAEMATSLWWVKMEELIAFFESFKKQKYVKIYERLDPPFIWEAWDEYEKERNEFLAHKNRMHQTEIRERKEGQAVKVIRKLGSTIDQIGEFKSMMKVNKKE